jgi:hypothetical protein
MKFFTQRLLDQACSSEEAVADKADADWNHAIVEYKKHLKSFRPFFTAGLREFLDEYCMHDAEIVSRGTKAGGQAYFIVAHFEPPSTKGVSLTFDLVGPAKQIGTPRLPSYWAYEEVERVKVKDRDAFRISILFADGSELRLPFSDLEVAPFKVAVPALQSTLQGRSSNGSGAGTAPPPQKERRG